MNCRGRLYGRLYGRPRRNVYRQADGMELGINPFLSMGYSLWPMVYGLL